MFFAHLSYAQIDSTKMFELSKGKWPLPLPKYLKIYDNENLKRYTSNQFDSTLRIITDSSYEVTAVHEGKIVGIFEVDGDYTVMTKFGKYFISYNSLTKPNLKEGEFIKAGRVLGRVVKNWTEENYTLHLYLSNGTKQISAQKWIDW